MRSSFHFPSHFIIQRLIKSALTFSWYCFLYKSNPFTRRHLWIIHHYIDVFPTILIICLITTQQKFAFIILILFRIVIKTNHTNCFTTKCFPHKCHSKNEKGSITRGNDERVFSFSWLLYHNFITNKFSWMKRKIEKQKNNKTSKKFWAWFFKLSTTKNANRNRNGNRKGNDTFSMQRCSVCPGK